jgi:ATP phosphoribosyltransferase
MITPHPPRHSSGGHDRRGVVSSLQVQPGTSVRDRVELSFIIQMQCPAPTEGGREELGILGKEVLMESFQQGDSFLDLIFGRKDGDSEVIGPILLSKS